MLRRGPPHNGSPPPPRPSRFLRATGLACLSAALLLDAFIPFAAMGDPPPNPEAPPRPQPSSRRSSQVQERRRSREASQPQVLAPDEAQQLQHRGSRSSRGSQDLRLSQTTHPRGSQGGTQPPTENLPELQSQEGLAGASLPDLQTSAYLGDDRIQPGELATNLMLQQLQQLQQQQDQGGLFQQLETNLYRDPGANMYQREDEQSTQHGPYLKDDPTLQFSPSELGFPHFGMEVPEPEPRELAVQNAKAYLLQTSIGCDLSL